MKKSISILCFAVLIGITSVYAERFVVIEQMTTTDTTECADTTCTQRSEYLYALLDTCKDKAVAICYYKDLLTTDDGDTRCSYYGWFYFGMGKLNGRTPPDGIGQINPDDVYYIKSTSINEEFNQDAIFEFYMASKVTGTNPNHSCSLTVISKALSDYTSTGIIRMHVAVIENSVNYQQSTGSAPKNGQAIHNYVCRQMLPTGAGSFIGDQTAGQENTARVAYINDDAKQSYENIRIVTFVQDYSNKKIIGAYLSSTHPFQDMTNISEKQELLKTDNIRILNINHQYLTFLAPHTGDYTLRLFSVNGQLVKVFKQKNVSKGINSIDLDTKNVANGIYFIELSSYNQKVAKKLVLY